MKNHELLDMIGEVNEDYVLEAGNNVVKPRFGWKTLAACAACAALVLAAYPVYRAVNPPLHDFTLMEGGGAMNTLGDEKAPAIGGGAGAYTEGEDKGGEDIDGAEYGIPGQEAAVDEEAANQYTGLLRGLGGQGGYEPETYPDWYGGAWIDHGGGPDTSAWLTVSIVDGFRTAELEAQIKEWCGGESGIVFKDAKYSLAHLYAIQDPAVEAVVGGGGATSCGVGVNVEENTLDIDVYGESISKEVLVRLGQLDPRGDAIRVRLFTGSITNFGDELYIGDEQSMKGPAPGGKTEPVFDGARVESNEETGQPARQIEDLPEPRQDKQPDLQPAEYDVIYGVAE